MKKVLFFRTGLFSGSPCWTRTPSLNGLQHFQALISKPFAVSRNFGTADGASIPKFRPRQPLTCSLLLPKCSASQSRPPTSYAQSVRRRVMTAGSLVRWVQAKKQKENHPFGWFSFCHSCPKKNWAKTEDFLEY